MPRKRIIDPEFWSDEEIGRWTRSARLLYIGLWNYADDCGRFKASAGLLKGQIFPYDDPKSLKFESLRKEVSDKIEWYEVDGLQYGYLRNFNKHQRIDRPQPSKLPPPPSQEFADNSTNNRGLVPPNIREVNIREYKVSANAPPPSEFINTLKTKPVYKGIDIDRELGKMETWLLTHPGRKLTQRFIVNWLNKTDKPVEILHKKHEQHANPNCTTCNGTGKFLEGDAKGRQCYCLR